MRSGAQQVRPVGRDATFGPLDAQMQRDEIIPTVAQMPRLAPVGAGREAVSAKNNAVHIVELRRRMEEAQRGGGRNFKYRPGDLVPVSPKTPSV